MEVNPLISLICAELSYIIIVFEVKVIGLAKHELVRKSLVLSRDKNAPTPPILHGDWFVKYKSGM